MTKKKPQPAASRRLQAQQPVQAVALPTIANPEPQSPAPPDRDPQGRFRPGVSGNPQGRVPGSTRRVSICTAAAELVEGEGLDLKTAVQQVLKAAFLAAQRGDVGAIKLLLERLASDEEQETERERIEALNAPRPQPGSPQTLDDWIAWANEFDACLDRIERDHPDLVGLCDAKTRLVTAKVRFTAELGKAGIAPEQ